MQQVRLFKGVENELREFEREINGWLQENDVKIVNVFGNIAPQSVSGDSKLGRKFESSDLFVVIVYEKE